MAAPTRAPDITISRVVIGPEEEAAVLQVLRSGNLAQGPVVAQLESAFAQVCGVPHAVAVSNGTVALVAALKALRIGPGDEVITTPFSFAATLNAILESGATVRFADIRDDYTIDPDSVAALVNDRTRAVMPVHLYGLPADMTARQWVAHSGLDVRHVNSGTSVHKVPRISKQGNGHLRRILYMPALVASRREPHVRAFYDQLVAAGKTPLQALVAIMRKLLHAVHGMLKTNTDFDGSKFRKLPQAA